MARHNVERATGKPSVCSNPRRILSYDTAADHLLERGEGDRARNHRHRTAFKSSGSRTRRPTATHYELPGPGMGGRIQIDGSVRAAHIFGCPRPATETSLPSGGGRHQSVLCTVNHASEEVSEASNRDERVLRIVRIARVASWRMDCRHATDQGTPGSILSPLRTFTSCWTWSDVQAMSRRSGLSCWSTKGSSELGAVGRPARRDSWRTHCLELCRPKVYLSDYCGIALMFRSSALKRDKACPVPRTVLPPGPEHVL